MSGKFKVWIDGESETNALEVEAYNHCDAAEKWAEEDDLLSAESAIANGEKVTVIVQGIDIGGRKRFEVTGEYTPVYYAEEVG